jgi:hypothetical protein
MGTTGTAAFRRLWVRSVCRAPACSQHMCFCFAFPTHRTTCCGVPCAQILKNALTTLPMGGGKVRTHRINTLQVLLLITSYLEHHTGLACCLSACEKVGGNCFLLDPTRILAVTNPNGCCCLSICAQGGSVAVYALLTRFCAACAHVLCAGWQ